MNFRFAWALQVGPVLIRPGEGSPLTVRFDVTKTSDNKPNTANIAVVNLSDTRVEALSALEGPEVVLRAGYQGAVDTIFSGQARDLWTVRETPDRITKIEAADGGDSYRGASINRAFGRNTPLSTVIVACAEAMGVGIGNTTTVAATATLDSGGNNFPTGTTLSGPAWRSLTRVCSSCGLRWSVQNGVLQLRAAGRPAVVSAVRLTPDTGLVGSPSRGQKDSRTGRVSYTVTSLMRPGLYPGRVVRVESKDLTANLLCKQTKHSGDTVRGPWVVNMELQAYDAR